MSHLPATYTAIAFTYSDCLSLCTLIFSPIAVSTHVQNCSDNLSKLSVLAFSHFALSEITADYVQRASCHYRNNVNIIFPLPAFLLKHIHQNMALLIKYIKEIFEDLEVKCRS